jgi:hypothetical protein
MEVHPRAGEAARGEKVSTSVAQTYPSADGFLCGSSHPRIEGGRWIRMKEPRRRADCAHLRATLSSSTAKEVGDDLSYVHCERGAGGGRSDDVGRRNCDCAANFSAEATGEAKH